VISFADIEEDIPFVVCCIEVLQYSYLLITFFHKIWFKNAVLSKHIFLCRRLEMATVIAVWKQNHSSEQQNQSWQPCRPGWVSHWIQGESPMWTPVTVTRHPQAPQLEEGVGLSICSV